ncbi:MAG: radical SAM protein, partial [Candidatus Acidiferrum sp.]
MRFPPRLKWDLARVRIAQKFSASSRRRLALHVDLADFPAQSEISPDDVGDPSQSVSSRDLHVLARVRENAAPVVWIGGESPLHYPRIGHLAQEIIKLDRTVFIEADGTLLRRRIHEFRPVSRLYLVLPLNGLEAAHDLRAQQPGNFRATVESIRTAKLSGFHICVETTIFADMELTELHKLAEFIQKLDVDGWIQTRPSVSAPAQPSEEKLTFGRKLIPNLSWRKFSEHLPLGWKSLLGEKLTLGAPHAEFACGEVGNMGSDSPNQELPTQEESIRSL